MKYSHHILISLISASVLLAGCSSPKAETADDKTAPDITVTEDAPAPAAGEMSAQNDANTTPVPDEGTAETPANDDKAVETTPADGGDTAPSSEDETSDDVDITENTDTPENEDGTEGEDAPVDQDVPEDEDAPVKGQPIVWLGDSLTQGSLGDDNDNLPGAPYEKLKTLVDVPVEGHGFYGWNTHDVLWVYTDKGQLGQMADPHKTYIFWLGSNDWVKDGEPNSDTAPVIKEIDRFLHLEGNIPNYIVIGTTSRHRLGDLYIPINRDLKEHYGMHYLDVIDIINRYGYSSDKTHLSQESYDAVATAVYEKLVSLGYI